MMVSPLSTQFFIRAINACNLQQYTSAEGVLVQNKNYNKQWVIESFN